MTDEAIIRKLAAVVVAEHGTSAARVAREELTRSIAAADEEQAGAWSAVCELLNSLGDGHGKAEPGLEEVLQGGVTRAVMRADGADESEVRDLAARQAKRGGRDRG